MNKNLILLVFILGNLYLVGGWALIGAIVLVGLGAILLGILFMGLLGGFMEQTRYQHIDREDVP